jgi:hypothetical protein
MIGVARTSSKRKAAERAARVKGSILMGDQVLDGELLLALFGSWQCDLLNQR